jgi:probable F420-dependent oxidoreductase
MKLGAIAFVTESSIAPDELAVALEDHGFESFWVGDHSHIPLPGIDTRSGKPVPLHYAHLMDPFVVLTYAAAATSTLRLGTSICLVNERDIITTAKQVATLDQLSGGRFLFGIGAGWNDQEMLDHGTDPRTRYASMRERVDAMKQIWTNEVAEYDGEHVKFAPMLCWPKPAQQPHPPIYIGGNWRNIPRVVAYGDGWIPSTTILPAEAFLQQMDELRQRAEEAGRGPIPVTALHVPIDDIDDLDVGVLEFTAEQWQTWADAGVERTVIMLPPHRDACLRLVERYARFAEGASA